MSDDIDPRKLIEPPGHTLDRLVRFHMEQTGEADYVTALQAVCRDPDNWPLIEEYQRWGQRLARTPPRRRK